MHRRIVSIQELQQEKELLLKIFEKFYVKYTTLAKEKKGILTNKEIEKVILLTKSNFTLTEQENDCAEAVFDMFFCDLKVHKNSEIAKKELYSILNADSNK